MTRTLYTALTSTIITDMMTNEQKKHLHLVLTNGGLAAVATIKPSAGPRVCQIELDTNLREV